MKVFNHTAHKALWNWLSKNPEMDKEDWPGWMANGGNVKPALYDCFACEYAYCYMCPILWKRDSECTLSEFGEWADEREERNFAYAAQLASQIRDLPVREGVVCK